MARVAMILGNGLCTECKNGIRLFRDFSMPVIDEDYTALALTSFTVIVKFTAADESVKGMLYHGISYEIGTIEPFDAQS